MNWQNVTALEEGLPKAKRFLQKWDRILFDLSAFPDGIDGTIDLLMRNGGILIVEDDNTTIGFTGYTIGERSAHYKNSHIGCIILLMIAPGYQKKYTVFKSYWRDLGREFKKFDVTYVRFKTYKDFTYQNAIYRKVATPFREELNNQGRSTILYELEFDRSKILQRLGVSNECCPASAT